MNLAAIASSFLALFGQAVTDTPRQALPAIEFDQTTAHGVQTFTRGGTTPARPRRIRGYIPWICGRAGQRLECTTGRSTRKTSAVAIYRANRRTSSIVIDIGPLYPPASEFGRVR